MRDREILRQMIRDTARVALHENYGKPSVTLCEPQSFDSSATIYNLPVDAMVIKVDAFRSPDDMFQGVKGECKRADYVIISTERKYILYIEMKRTKHEWGQIVKQLKGAQCFAKYYQQIGKVLPDYKDPSAKHERPVIPAGMPESRPWMVT